MTPDSDVRARSPAADDRSSVGKTTTTDATAGTGARVGRAPTQDERDRRVYRPTRYMVHALSLPPTTADYVVPPSYTPMMASHLTSLVTGPAPQRTSPGHSVCRFSSAIVRR